MGRSSIYSAALQKESINMKYTYKLLIALSLVSMHIVAMEEGFKTDFSHNEENPVIVTSSDGNKFRLSSSLAKLSELIKDMIKWAETDKPRSVEIPKDAEISGETLERLLLLADQGPFQITVDKTLSLDELITLLEAENYFNMDIQRVKNPLLKAIGKKLTWNEDVLINFFDEPGFLLSYQKSVAKTMAEELSWDLEKLWDEKFLTDFYAYKKLSKEAKLLIIQAFIVSDLKQLVQFVDYDNIHLKESRELKRDPMKVFYMEPELTEVDKKRHQFLKKVLGSDDYKIIQDNLRKEYPGQ